MKHLIIIVLFLAAACSSSTKEATSNLLDPAAFDARIKSGAVLLDVRTVEEYASGHISGSINMDIKNPGFEENVKMLDKSKEYAVYCASGVRSGKAAEMMRADGFTNVYTLAGGIKTWKEKGMPLE